jgi:hypothetical protein
LEPPVQALEHVVPRAILEQQVTDRLPVALRNHVRRDEPHDVGPLETPQHLLLATENRHVLVLLHATPLEDVGLLGI